MCSLPGVIKAAVQIAKHVLTLSLSSEGQWALHPTVMIKESLWARINKTYFEQGEICK